MSKAVMMRKILFLVFYLIQSLKVAQSSINKVVCADSTASQLIQCEENQIIDIQNVTIGILTYCMNIPEMQRFGQFYALHPLCVRSLKQDGEQVYRRCHGEQSCTLDGSVVPIEQLTFQTDVCGWKTSTALWFRYSCQKVRSGKVDEMIQYNARELHIFSLCFPSYTPKPTAGWYQIGCTIVPDRTGQYKTFSFKITPKLIKMYSGSRSIHCHDYLFFNRGSSSDPVHRFGRYYCSPNEGVQVEVWNDDVISVDTVHDVYITYLANTEALGSKYWFVVTATRSNDGSPVQTTATCKATGFLIPECPSPLPPTVSPSLTPPPPPPPTPTPTTTTTTKTTSTTSTTTTTTPAISTTKTTTAEPLMTSPAQTPSPQTHRTPQSPGTKTDTDKTGSNDREKSNSSNVALFWALGGIIGLVIVVAVIAVLLFLFLRKKRKNNENNEIQTDETDELNGQNKRRSRVMTVLAKIKGADTNTDEEKATKPKPELKPKPMFAAKPQIKPKPKTIVQMETMSGEKKVDPKPMNGALGERVAVVKPLKVFATVEKKQTRKNIDSPEEAVEVDENANIYAVPIKKKSKEELIRNKDEDEVVMVDNDDLYGTAAATREIEAEIETDETDDTKDESRSNEEIDNDKGDMTPESNKRNGGYEEEKSGDTVHEEEVDGLYSVATPIKEDRGSTENEKQGDEDILYDNANLKPKKNNELKSIEDNVSENKDDLYDNANLKSTKNNELKSIEDNVSENNDDDWDDDEQLKLSGLNKPGNRSSVV